MGVCFQKGIIMRSDRRKEILAQMEAERRAERNKKGNAFCRVLSIIYSILVIAFMVLLAYMNVLPGKYYWTAVGALAVASIFIVPVCSVSTARKAEK